MQVHDESPDDFSWTRFWDDWNQRTQPFFFVPLIQDAIVRGGGICPEQSYASVYARRPNRQQVHNWDEFVNGMLRHNPVLQNGAESFVQNEVLCDGHIRYGMQLQLMQNIVRADYAMSRCIVLDDTLWRMFYLYDPGGVISTVSPRHHTAYNWLLQNVGDVATVTQDDHNLLNLECVPSTLTGNHTVTGDSLPRVDRQIREQHQTPPIGTQHFLYAYRMAQIAQGSANVTACDGEPYDDMVNDVMRAIVGGYTLCIRLYRCEEPQLVLTHTRVLAYVSLMSNLVETLEVHTAQDYAVVALLQMVVQIRDEIESIARNPMMPFATFSHQNFVGARSTSLQQTPASHIVMPVLLHAMRGGSCDIPDATNLDGWGSLGEWRQIFPIDHWGDLLHSAWADHPELAHSYLQHMHINTSGQLYITGAMQRLLWHMMSPDDVVGFEVAIQGIMIQAHQSSGFAYPTSGAAHLDGQVSALCRVCGISHSRVVMAVNVPSGQDLCRIVTPVILAAMLGTLVYTTDDVQDLHGWGSLGDWRRIFTNFDDWANLLHRSWLSNPDVARAHLRHLRIYGEPSRLCLEEDYQRLLWEMMDVHDVNMFAAAVCAIISRRQNDTSFSLPPTAVARYAICCSMRAAPCTICDLAHPELRFSAMRWCLACERRQVDIMNAVLSLSLSGKPYSDTTTLHGWGLLRDWRATFPTLDHWANTLHAALVQNPESARLQLQHLHVNTDGRPYLHGEFHEALWEMVNRDYAAQFFSATEVVIRQINQDPHFHYPLLRDRLYSADVVCMSCTICGINRPELRFQSTTVCLGCASHI